MIDEPRRLSYSSLSSLMECGERWRLERGYHLNASTWFATVGGSAVHHITELYDLARIGYPLTQHETFIAHKRIPTFKEEFDRLLDIEEEKGIKVKPSGRVLKAIGENGGPDKKNYDWWLVYGPIYLQRWEDWVATCGLALLVLPDGEPAIEVKLDVDFGDEPQLGFIDRVYVDGNSNVVIVDIKTGNVPVSKLQLGIYRAGLLRKYGIEASQGAYWMAKDGQLTPLADLTVYSPAWLDEMFERGWKVIRAGLFMPNVTNMCTGCGVKDWCRAVGGSAAITIPIKETVVPAFV